MTIDSGWTNRTREDFRVRPSGGRIGLMSEVGGCARLNRRTGVRGHGLERFSRELQTSWVVGTWGRSPTCLNPASAASDHEAEPLQAGWRPAPRGAGRGLPPTGLETCPTADDDPA